MNGPVISDHSRLKSLLPALAGIFYSQKRPFAYPSQCFLACFGACRENSAA